MPADKGPKRAFTAEKFPIVCIGMSAGGVLPLKTIFKSLTSSTGMAFVVIHHVRTLPTRLPRLLAGWTEMPVETVSHGLQLRPSQVYVLPSGKEIELMDGSFGLRQRTKPRGWANVISLFVDSLSKSGHLGIAVILSGLDADGAQALAKFSQEGGITFVQDPKTAKNPQMPEAAIRTGHVNYVLPPDAIADRLEQCGEELSTVEAYL